MLTRQIKVQIERIYFIHNNRKVKNGDLGGKKHHFIFFFLVGRVFFIFRQKMYGVVSSEMDMKVPISAPT